MDFDKMIRKSENISEINELNKKYKSIAEKILNEFGPEGSYKISDILKRIVDEDIKNGMGYMDE